MDHAGEGRLMAFVDGQLGAAEQAAVERHVRACPACAEELSALREASARVSASLRLLDTTAPAPAPVAAVGERTGGVRVAAVRRTLLRAAGVVLMLAGGGAAALPGSPVRAWARAVWERGRALLDGPVPAEVVEAQPGEPAAAAASIGVDASPADGRIRVSLVHLPAGAEVRVRLVDRAVAWVEAVEVAGPPPQFVRGPGRVEVVGSGVRGLRIDLPRGVVDARVEVDGRLHVFKDGEVLRVVGAREAAGGPVAEFRIGR